MEYKKFQPRRIYFWSTELMETEIKKINFRVKWNIKNISELTKNIIGKIILAKVDSFEKIVRRILMSSELRNYIFYRVVNDVERKKIFVSIHPHRNLTDAFSWIIL